MGFPCVNYDVVLPKPLSDLLDLLARIKFMITLALFYLGLFDPTDIIPSHDDHLRQFPTHPSSVSSPFMKNKSCFVTPETIKKLLPVIQFSDFIARSDGCKESEETVCIICLNEVERSQKIRDLYNCSHVFHSYCFDKWVDLGHTSCPLCRSKLLKDGEDELLVEDSWVLDTLSHLFEEDWTVD